MEQDEMAVPIVFISNSKRLKAGGVDPAVQGYIDREDRAGIEEVITFLTQSSQPE
jgi:hypothetical protein